MLSHENIQVALDCANGSSWNVAKAVFDALGAKTLVINAEPNGTNINNNAGSTHIGGLQKFAGWWGQAPLNFYKIINLDIRTIEIVY